jgi:chromosome segregation ATPase
MTELIAHWRRCDLFNKAYNHIADRIDQVYKDLTKGKAAPMGGVAYLSLEDTEVMTDFAGVHLRVRSQHIRNPIAVVLNTTPCHP